MRLIISQIAISKSICGNLNSRLKNLGIFKPSLRVDGGVPPKLEGPLVRGNDMCGFMVKGLSRAERGGYGLEG